MLFVGAAGLVDPEHSHCRGTSIPCHPYKKIKPLLQTFSVVVIIGRDIHWIWIDLLADGDSYLVTGGERLYVYPHMMCTWPADPWPRYPLFLYLRQRLVSREEGSRGAVVNIPTDFGI